MRRDEVKTERIGIDDTEKTRKIDIDFSNKDSQETFTGSLKVGEKIEGYVVQSLITAHTGEAEIYFADCDGERAVIKYYHPQFKPKEEILKKLQGIDHPDIIKLYKYGKYKGRFFEILEYAAGGSLADKKPDGSFKYLPMTEEKVKQIVKECVNAFYYFHKAGIIHRDIKPSNLFYRNANGTDLVIGDFGISSELDVEGGMSKRMTSTIALTEGYAAPELYGVAKDDNKAKILIGPEVDYYALGITVYEMLTAINPFEGRNALHIMRDTIEGRVVEDLLTRPEAKKISDNMKRLIRGLLTVRHDKRWGKNEVIRWLNGEEVEVWVERVFRSIPELKFGDKSITSIDELVKSIDKDRELGKKYLMRGLLDQWAAKFDASLANEIIDIKEMNADEDFKVKCLLYKFDPSLPCKLGDTISINNYNDILENMRNEPLIMGRYILGNAISDFYTWVYVHYPELYEQLVKAKEIYESKGIISDASLIRNIHNLYVVLAEKKIKPFRKKDYEIASVNDLLRIPDTLKGEAIENLKNKDSILYLYLLQQNIPNFEKAWDRLDKTWDNFVSVIRGDIVEFNGTLMTKEAFEKQKQDDLNEVLRFHSKLSYFLRFFVIINILTVLSMIYTLFVAKGVDFGLSFFLYLIAFPFIYIFYLLTIRFLCGNVIKLKKAWLERYIFLNLYSPLFCFINIVGFGATRSYIFTYFFLVGLFPLLPLSIYTNYKSLKFYKLLEKYYNNYNEMIKFTNYDEKKYVVIFWYSIGIWLGICILLKIMGIIPLLNMKL